MDLAKAPGYFNDDGLLVIDADKVAEIRRLSEAKAADVKARKFRPGMLHGKPRDILVTNVGGPASGVSMVIRTSGAGNSELEYDDRQDAVARPDPIRYSLTAAAARAITSSQKGSQQ